MLSLEMLPITLFTPCQIVDLENTKISSQDDINKLDQEKRKKTDTCI